MNGLLPRRAGYVCKACRTALRGRNMSRNITTTEHRPASLREQLQKRGPEAIKPAKLRAVPKSSRSTVQIAPTYAKDRIQQVLRERDLESVQVQPKDDRISSTTLPIDTSNPKGELESIQKSVLEILSSDRLPSDAAVLSLLDRSFQLSDLLISSQPETSQGDETRIPREIDSDDPLLVDLDEPRVSRQIQSTSKAQASVLLMSDRESAAQALCKALYTLLADPKVFINERVLSAYVRIICLLGQPEYLPKIFYLYSHKLIPKPNTYPIKYKEPSPRMPKYAVPRPLADMAIDAAILRKDMPLCIAIIDTTVATDQYKADRFIRKGLLPCGAVAMTIPICWSASDWASHVQHSWDPHVFFWMCMSGAGAYVGTMVTLLWITATTWNHHHKRVRWIPGTTLGRRWVREDERLYFDKIAQAWGYQDIFKHGEETGEEWEALRETLTGRWLQLDRTSLLPGML